MRRAEDDDDEYSTGSVGYSYEDRPLWPSSSYPPAFNPSPHGPSSTAGYPGQGGIWAPSTQGSSYNGGPYVRQDSYGQHRQGLPSHSDYNTLSQRQYEQLSSPISTAGYGRDSLERSVSITSTSQPHWEPYASSSSSAHTYYPSSSTEQIHTYRALPSTPQHTVESYLTSFKPEGSSGRRAYQCTWPGCPKAGEPFKSKDNARVHVHKHFGSEKLWECTVNSCKKRFASEDAAKRHRDTTESKAFSCTICYKEFARKDYRDVHQRKCTG